MERKNLVHLFLPVVLFLFFVSCHARRVSDIKPNMTKEEVASLWGKTPLVTHKTVDEKAVEIWEYHFSGSGSDCWITFSQERVEGTQCRPVRVGTYYSYSQQGQDRVEAPVGERSLVREGYFAMELAEVLKIGEVNSEAEAESRLASLGIAPKNGWIADYPVTPNIIGELQRAVEDAADSGKIAMNREEAIGAFQDLIASLESQNARVEPPPDRVPYPEPYYYPRFYFYPYYFSYPYTFGGYYRFHHRHPGHWR
jgi:hypothetical protein